MNIRYAKLVDSRLEVLYNVPGISNPNGEQVKNYALTHGYKVLEETSAPGKYYTSSYVEQDDKIVKVWTPEDLGHAKAQALTLVQTVLDSALSQRVTVECSGFENGIIYDQNALTNAIGLEEGDMFIDAQDGVHQLTAENVVNIKKALKDHRLDLYMKVTVKRTAINEATTVDEVEAAEKEAYNI